MQINERLTIAEVAAIVSETLEQAEIIAVLSGGSVVSIYSDNEYQSQDLDFISSVNKSKIALALEQIGFKPNGKHFEHPNTEYFLDFPSSPLAIGQEIIDYRDCDILTLDVGKIRILSPTQCVMDRLAAFYHWNDKQSLDQALMVARRHDIELKKVKSWSKKEGHPKKFNEFLKNLKNIQSG